MKILSKLFSNSGAQTTLFREDILKEIKEGGLQIAPFNPELVKEASIDLSLGEYYFEQNEDYEMRAQIGGPRCHNPFDQFSRNLWKCDCSRAKPAQICADEHDVVLKGFDPKDLAVVIKPKQSILSASLEFVKLGERISLHLDGRSSPARLLLRAAGPMDFIDPGYVDPVTFLITNPFDTLPVVLKVGTRLVQFEVKKGGPGCSGCYGGRGKYSSPVSLEEAQAAWQPEMMHSKMHLDPEAFPSMTVYPDKHITSRAV
ncbi:MAG: hypothetical protein HYT43_00105 [Candidatus Taylorbacteria bacterium]|nr:hypothetical protein [Candidatus Taylorbacteria bacterium]